MNHNLLFSLAICFVLLQVANSLRVPSLRRLLAANPLLARPLMIDQRAPPKRAPLVVEPPVDLLTFSTGIRTAQKPKVLFVLGGPGAGKGTQCVKLSTEFGISHLSAGDLLREEVASGSPLGQEIATYIKEGAIVPVRVTVELLRKKIFTLKKPANRVLIDGFPRNHENLEGWNEIMNDLVDLEGVIFIDCPEEEMLKRLLSRGLTSGRTDDNIETAKKRFTTYHAATMPIVDHFEREQKLLRIGGHQPVATVYEELKQSIIPLIEKEIIQVTTSLEDAIDRHDWHIYQSLCQTNAEMGFHKLLFDFNDTIARSISTLRLSPNVEISGTTAKISYSNITREWQLTNGQWKMTSYTKQ